MTTERSRPQIRSFLDLSSNNLPQEVFNELTSLDGVVAYPTTAPSCGSPTTRRTRTT